MAEDAIITNNNSVTPEADQANDAGEVLQQSTIPSLETAIEPAPKQGDTMETDESNTPDADTTPLLVLASTDQSAMQLIINEADAAVAVNDSLMDTLTPSTSVARNQSVASSSLSLLAEYDSSEDSDDSSNEGSSSDSDSSEDEEGEEDRTGVVSSGLEIPDLPTSSTDSSDSESDSDSSAKSLSAIRKVVDRIEPVGDDDDEDCLLGDDDEKRPPRRLKVPGEMGIDELPPIEDLHITVPENQCEILGKVSTIVEQLVLVESIPNKVPFDLDTVLFLDKGRTPLGKVFDVMGPVHCPIYVVRFNSNQDVVERNIVPGLDVYCAPMNSCSQIVILSTLQKFKGSDASWQDDIEPPDRYLEYSDDEQERAARKARKNRKQGEGGDSNNPIEEPNFQQLPNGRPHGPPRPMARPRRSQQNQAPPHHYPQYGPSSGSYGYGRRNPNFRPQTPPQQQCPPQYFRMPPNSGGTGPGSMYPNPYANVGQFYANPFAFTPQVNYPPFNPALFGSVPPPPPPPSFNRR